MVRPIPPRFLPARFPHNGGFEISSFERGFLKGLSINNGFVYRDGLRPLTISNATGAVSAYVPGYTRIDAGLSYAVNILNQRVSLSVRVQNIADREYWEGYQGKGNPRMYRFSAATRF